MRLILRCSLSGDLPLDTYMIKITTFPARYLRAYIWNCVINWANFGPQALSQSSVISIFCQFLICWTVLSDSIADSYWDERWCQPLDSTSQLRMSVHRFGHCDARYLVNRQYVVVVLWRCRSCRSLCYHHVLFVSVRTREQSRQG